MLSDKEIDAVQETAEELKRRRENRPNEGGNDKPKAAAGDEPKKKRTRAEADRAWARANLRFQDGRPILDIANALRVLDRHEAFKGRFRFNETLSKVLDKGTVMLDWRVAELAAILQERFLPAIPQRDVEKALYIHANKVIQKK